MKKAAIKKISKISKSGTPLDQVLFYQTDDGRNRIEVRMEEENVWLSQLAMADHFQTTKQNISLHVKNILAEDELKDDSVVKEYSTTASDVKQIEHKSKSDR